ncbi:unnamed protein product [marine sediment metagenome]|uniref:Uncharacterized protein n=1 Tax=marine sediment metagenome TaxID=412755 RepID=X1UXF0_9ZZZZ
MNNLNRRIAESTWKNTDEAKNWVWNSKDIFYDPKTDNFALIYNFPPPASVSAL